MKEIILVLSFFGMGVYGVLKDIQPIAHIFVIGVGAIIILDVVDAYREHRRK